MVQFLSVCKVKPWPWCGVDHRRRLWSKLGGADCAAPVAPVGAKKEGTGVVGNLLRVVGEAGVFPPHMTPGWEVTMPPASYWLPAGGAATPGGAHAATPPDTVGQGATATARPDHWFPGGPFWPWVIAVGEYGGEEYGEPPSGCVGNMERIWEVERFDCGESVRKVEDEEKWVCKAQFCSGWYFNVRCHSTTQQNISSSILV